VAEAVVVVDVDVVDVDVVDVEDDVVDVEVETVNVTGMACGVFVAPVAETVIVAEYVPAARPELYAVTLNEDGAVPERGESASQDAAVLTLQVKTPLPELEIATACPAGSLPPCVAEKERLAGLKLIAAFDIIDVDAETVNVTGMVCGVFVAPVAETMIAAE